MRFFLLIPIISLLLGCNSSNKEMDDFGAFKLTLPDGWKKFKESGIDSYVGGLTDGTDTLRFDYGWYSYDLSYEDPNKQLFATDTINGKITLITKPKHPGMGTIGIYIEKAFKDNRFNLIGADIENEDLVLEIFKSLTFTDSDSTLNSLSIEFSNEITPYSGRSLFLINCAACHHRERNMTGPAFASIEEMKFRQWILESTDLIQTNSIEFGIGYHQRTFGKQLTENDIQKLIEYGKIE